MLPRASRVIRSPRNSTANSATQAGMVNSSANTVASGSSVIASVQQICEAKCATLRPTCSAHVPRAACCAVRAREASNSEQNDRARRRCAPT